MFCKNEKIEIFGLGGSVFFSCSAAPAVPALRSSFLLYSQGFVLLTFKNGVEIAAVEGGAASINGHAVPKGQEWPYRDPGTGGGVLEPRRDVRGSKNRFWMKIAVYLGKSTVHFGRNL